MAPRLCVGLDVATGDEAAALAAELAEVADVFKVGLELFCSQGPAVVERVAAAGKDVFCDLKINDIPRQSAGAVTSAARIGAAYVTVHGNAGRPTLEAACEAAGRAGTNVLVVSVLTSLDDQALSEAGVGRTAAEQVELMAALADDVGAHGLVLSTVELPRIRSRFPDLRLVTPGIRPAGSDVGDQRRVGTPSEAVAAGADMLVVARPIVAAEDPAAAAHAVREEMLAAAPTRARS